MSEDQLFVLISTRGIPAQLADSANFAAELISVAMSVPNYFFPLSYLFCTI